jgi:acetyl esterase/lipase
MSFFRKAAFAAGLIALIAFSGALRAQEVEIQNDVEFAKHDGVALQADLYMPKAPGKYPALVAVFGGGWQVGSRKTYKYWGPYLAARGYVVMAANYRLMKPGEKTYPQAVHDIRAAVQWIKSRGEAIKVDATRVGLMGDSAGGHLAALVGLAGDAPAFAGAYRDDPFASVSTKVKVVVGAYGVYDMVAQWNHDQITRPRDQIVEKFLGVPPMENRQLYFDASPMSYAITANNATSFLLTYGTEDDIVDRKSQSDAFLNALKQARFFARNAVIQGYGHFWFTDPIEEPGSPAGQLAPRLLRFLADRL